MDTETKDEIDKLSNIILETIFPDEIILFDVENIGSLNENQSISLCILINDGGNRKSEIFKKVEESILPQTDLSIQFLIYYKDEFYEMANMNTTLENKIIHEGKRIYG